MLGVFFLILVYVKVLSVVGSRSAPTGQVLRQMPQGAIFLFLSFLLCKAQAILSIGGGK